ncbi:hypothetical protein B0H15DRAFT_800617 [Mycena belliarum]|uniref:Uncharacterized protein n=1 Tax=Mycena belliarum TaxID=1033014 RepID=A0AAD6U6T3_9AGAR|nr:hypothetical protein B0H15DRAFT_800617 [Mycena belliae]
MAANSTTYASRNPTLAVQKKRNRAGRPKGPLTAAQKATRALQVAQRKVKRRGLEEDMDAFFEDRDALIEKLAEKHGRTSAYIRTLLTNPSQFKAKRAMSLRNAIAHDLSLKAHESGTKRSVQELSAEADILATTKSYTKEEEAFLFNQLKAKRELSRVGMRGNNLSAAADARSVASRVHDEFTTLFERTGTRCIAFFSRGHVDDGFLPTYAESGGSMDFFLQSLQVSGLDAVRRFEQWCCIQDRAPRTLETLNGLRHQIKTLITGGLQTITKDKTLAMSYSRYLVDIMQYHKVKLVGWPSEIPFVNSSQLGTIDRVRRIADGLRNGQIYWVHLQPEEVAEVEAEVQQRRDNGTLNKARKPRADAGKKRKRNTDDSDGEDEQQNAPAPASSAAAAAPAYSAAAAAPAPASSAPAPASSAAAAAAPAFSAAPAAPAPASSAPAPASSAAAAAAPAVPYVAPPVIDLGVIPAPQGLIMPDYDSFDFTGMETLDLSSFSLDGIFGSAEPGLDFGAPSNQLYAFPSLHGAPAYLAANATGVTTAAAATGVASALPASQDLTGAYTAGGVAYPAATAPLMDVAGVGNAAPAARSGPFGAIHTGGVQFNAPATPASFSNVRAAVGKKRIAPKSTDATADTDNTTKKPRKTRADKGKSRAKVAAIENESPEEVAARKAKRKALALKKLAARAGRW